MLPSIYTPSNLIDINIRNVSHKILKGKSLSYLETQFSCLKEYLTLTIIIYVDHGFKVFQRLILSIKNSDRHFIAVSKLNISLHYHVMLHFINSFVLLTCFRCKALLDS